jgi:hypothetical protein
MPLYQSLYRVQLLRNMANVPAGAGSHHVWSGGWFQCDHDGSVDTVAFQAFQRLWTGCATTVLGNGAVQNGANAGRITVWDASGAGLVKVGTTFGTLDSGPSGAMMPSQVAVAVGYRHAPGPIVQRGRSRWFIGPVSIAAGATLVSPGGLRLTPAAVDNIAASMAAQLVVLAGRGWHLRVKGVEGVTTPVELYVDDVLDVIRTRRTWRAYQKRVTL